MITIVAQYQAQPGGGDKIASALAKHVPATRLEPGCVQFVAYRSTEDPDRFVLFERYVDDQALAAHRASPHFRDYVENTIAPALLERRFARYQEVEADPEGRAG